MIGTNTLWGLRVKEKPKQMTGNIYEVQFLLKHGDYPRVTHVLATSPEEAIAKVSEGRKIAKIIEVIKM